MTDTERDAVFAQAADDNRLQSLFTIGDMARLYGITLRALRFYEDRGLIAPLRHGTTRFYDPECRKRLELILKGKHLGFTLTQIRAMLARENDAQQTMLGIDAGEVEVQIARLERKRDDLDHAISELRMACMRMSEVSGRATVAA